MLNIGDIEDMMYEAVSGKHRVSIKTKDGDELEGVAFIYSSGDDEEDGYSRLVIKDGEEMISLGADEIDDMDFL